MKLIDIDKLKKFFIVEPKLEESDIEEALVRYCRWCKRGFKDKRARDAHNRIVHDGVLRKFRKAREGLDA